MSPTTLLPFLYQTRTLQRLSRAGLSKPAFRAFLHATAGAHSPRAARPPRAPSKDAIPFELPPDIQVDSEESKERSTITPTEREAFNRIFEEIAARGGKLPTGSSQTNGTPMSAAQFSADLKTAASRHGNIIIQDATTQNDARKKPFNDPFRPFTQMVSAEDREKALLRFPPSLRRAARMAYGVIEPDVNFDGSARGGEADTLAWEQDRAATDHTAGAREEPRRRRVDDDMIGDDLLALDPSAKSAETESLRRSERSRVETRMSQCETDFELWDVMEQEVFGMVDKLGIGEQQQQQPKTKRGRNKVATTTQEKDGEELSMQVHGPLYPSYLLYALRLMDQNFATTSPLALSILPRIKELGLASYVLGVSTPFYNALMSIYWRRYGDMGTVFNLLEEMRHAGLYCDEGSLAILHSAEHFFTDCEDGKKGPFLKELAALPDYEVTLKPKFRQWSATIGAHISERRRDLGH
ncbi:hypothetical protein QBC46DRAFT_393934 [Diplogelasinospora grovesii]|uniref:Mtf2-like C-terminal domain-containing protein n=1 Tax=Diplogelasinospora grovesii TaxID=303347 RepID=A0AAN6S1E5_9PEZI|nr:hypothetical protein QBC46DRAFT_393934 [Diplogelasinospora grovesii]